MAEDPINFYGNAKRLTEKDLEATAKALDCEVEVIKAVVEIEASGDGFLVDKRPKILFEAHIFSRQTDGRYDGDRRYQNISSPHWDRSLYGASGAHQYDRLHAAMALDVDAALKSASWGAFQVMGFHWERLGYPSVREYVGLMTESEGRHLEAFTAYVNAFDLAKALRTRDWATFARRYNGSGYKTHKYDERLANAYERHKAGSGTAVHYAPDSRVLRSGDKGSDVEALQKELNEHGAHPRLKVDGAFGAATERAVRAFQERHGLLVDGVVGPATWRALNGEAAVVESMAPASELGGEYENYGDVDEAVWSERYPNFTPKEIACKGTGRLLVNERAMDMLQALRTALGRPMTINSAYRSPEHNAAVGGAKASRHLEGIAFDVSMRNQDPLTFERAAIRAGFMGFGYYPGSQFIHIDARTSPARWGTRWFA